jgi:hypothetical protein
MLFDDSDIFPGRYTFFGPVTGFIPWIALSGHASPPGGATRPPARPGASGCGLTVMKKKGYFLTAVVRMAPRKARQTKYRPTRR